MKRIVNSLVCACFAFVLCGCQNSQTRAGEGAVIGGILGAAAGGIIGHQGHHGGEGAAIGAAAGALTGALVGSQINKQPGSAPQQSNTTTQSAQVQGQNPSQLTVQQIIDMTKQGVHEAVIIDKIRLTNSKFSLTNADVTLLKNNGVSQQVINVMQGTA